ncbi:MAG: dienelactone hydrolase family protein [Candidatus Acidiferrales bacterium]
MKLPLRLFFAIIFVALGALPVCSSVAGASALHGDTPPEATPLQVKTETVEIPVEKATIAGYMAYPDTGNRYPAIVLVHEWWGLNDWIKEQAQKFAAQGYAVLAVDLYRGKVATDPMEAHELMRGLPQDLAMRDLEAGLVYLVQRKEVTRDRLAVVGWCMGGGLAIQFAIRQPHLSACIVNYGALPTDPNDMQQIGAAVLGNFGADDRGITPTDVQDFQKAMQNANRRVDVKIYEGAGHGFENPANATYRPAAAADAWQRMINFLNKTMH